MYKAITRWRVRRQFDALGGDDFDAIFKDVAENVHHVFPGDNAIGGERHSRDAMVRWFARVRRLIPDLNFAVDRVSVRGWPWDMWVAVQWRDWGHAADGEPYENEGAHWIRLRRGKATDIHAYLDSDRVTRVLRRLAAAGHEEAAAAPITE